MLPFDFLIFLLQPIHSRAGNGLQLTKTSLTAPPPHPPNITQYPTMHLLSRVLPGNVLGNQNGGIAYFILGLFFPQHVSRESYMTYGLSQSALHIRGTTTGPRWIAVAIHFIEKL